MQSIVEQRRFYKYVFGNMDAYRKQYFFQNWADTAFALSRLRNALDRLFKRSTEHRMSVKLQRWHSYASATRRKMAQVSNLLFGKYQVAYFKEWRQAAKFSVLIRSLAGKAFQHFFGRVTKTVLLEWRRLSDKKLKRIQTLRGALAKLRQREMLAAWSLWHDNVVEVVTNREKVKKSLARIIKGAMFRAFSQWHDVATTLAYHRRVVSEALTRIRLREAAAAFSLWTKHTMEAQDDRAKLQKAMAKFVNSQLAGAFAQWVSFYEESVRLREVALKVMSRVANRENATAFDKWFTVLEEAREMRAAIAKAARAWVRRAESTAFNTWRANVEEAAELRSKLQKAMAKFMNKTLYAGFTAFVEHAGVPGDA